MHGRRDRARARLRAAERALDAIGTTLDERQLCEELAGFLCPGLCDAAAVDVLPGDDATGTGAAAEAATATGTRAPGLPGAAQALARATAQGRTELLDAEGARPAHGRLLDGRAPTVLRVPMIAHGRVHGVLVAARAGKAFTGDETETLRYAAHLTALLIGHARSHAAARGTALNLQRALLAEPGRPHPNLEIATRYLPSGRSNLVGGDWFETVRLHYGRTLLVVGDVMGHGLDAAVDMNAYRSALRYVASADLPPHRVLRHLDATVSAMADRRPATCLLVRVDPARGTATFAGAGHLPPVLFTADGEAELVPVPVGPPLGTGAGGYEPLTRALTGTETLLLFTDGLVERRNEDIDVSLARVTGRWAVPGIGAEELVDAVLARCDAEHAEDDVAVLAARVRRRAAGGPACAGAH
ncbi:PP2C family protein-serine/threonine phosphatase [Streptomyces sp. t39]|uniref:PP2C family protein-serine/threonine phosphatase n=1 Tax=Streptomyces sp. t39 TaxID=1828156 RepID=UPI0011CE34A7|nr:PP2C family protein-serine/threonine phosphatase [Streptomyces sp. t39]TXS52173.1 serine/threonine-protein phosphatase [Streptomyces sp. t39]